MKLKILHLAQFLGVGGLEKILFLLIKEQISAGHHIELVIYDYEQSWVEYFRSNGIIVHSDFRKNEGYDLKLLQMLNSMVSSFDIIHTHDLNPLMYAAPLKLWRRALDLSFPRLIHTAHGTEHIIRRPVTKIYEKLCSLMADTIVGVGPAVKDFYIKDLLVEPHKVVNINNGTMVDQEKNNRASARENLVKKFNLPHDGIIWTNVARIVPLKNQGLLIEAARMRPEIELLLIGPSGDYDYWDSLVKDLPQNVHMPGARSDIDEILEGSDFFVSASTHEGIPVAALEAGAKALPCLLSSIPGHLALQKSAENKVAEYFESTNISQLMGKMLYLEAQSSKARELAINLHRHVKSNFSSERMYQEYLRTYVGII